VVPTVPIVPPAEE
jgi:hypothetical protein